MPSANSKSYSVNSIRKDPYVPGQTTRDPIGLARLLEVYDDYPVVLRSLEAATTASEAASEAAQAATARAEGLETELSSEREGRKADSKRAKDDADLALKTAAAQKAAAETARETKVRAELQPKIDDLQRRFAAMKADRDRLRADLEEKRVQYAAWVGQMEGLHARRQEAEERERKAEEDRRALASEMRELDQQITEGLKEAASRPIPGEIRRGNGQGAPSVVGSTKGTRAGAARTETEKGRTASLAPTTRSTAPTATAGAGAADDQTHAVWGKSASPAAAKEEQQEHEHEREPEHEHEETDGQSVKPAVDAREAASVNGV